MNKRGLVWGVVSGALSAIAFSSGDATAGDQTVYFNDFDTDVSIEIDPGVALLTGVQGFDMLGHPENQFGGQFLRSPSSNIVTLTLGNLPPHDSVSIHFLFAAIDSLDGTGAFPKGDFFRVDIDDVQIFRESFANATADQVQSYMPPDGVELARRVDLGFNTGSFYLDSAYDMSLDPVFSFIPHTADSITVSFQMEGPGQQPLSDESWAVDRLTVLTHNATACLADLNDDGILNFFDVSAFLTAYSAQDPAADLTGDGVYDFFDVSAFLSAFAAGCP